MKYKKMIWTIIGLCTIGAIFLSYLYVNRPMEVVGNKPVKMTIEDSIVETGNIGYEKTQTVYAERSGKIVSLAKAVGETVKAGELIISFDDQGLLLQLKDAEEKISSAKAQLEGVKISNYADQLDQISLEIVEIKRQLELANSHQKDVEALYASGAISESELKTAKDETAMLDSKLKLQTLSKEQLEKGSPNYQKRLSQAQLAQAITYRDQMHYEASLMKVIAPIGGIILEKWVDDGAFVTQGSPLLKIGDARKIKVEVDILSDEVDGLTLGDKVLMTASYLPDVIVEGKVVKIAPIAKETTSSLGISQKRLPVTVEVTSHQKELIPNMPMEVKIIKNVKQDVWCLPITAIREDHQGVYVYGIVSGKITRVNVKLGIQSGEWQEITDGVTEGMLILSEPGADTTLGQSVTLKP